MRQRNTQRGFALLIMLVIVVLGSLYAVTGQLEFASRKYARDELTMKSLLRAKEALIGYAATYRDNYGGQVFGYLPCPDLNGDGSADTLVAGCNTADGNAVVGLLPYKELGLPDLRDSSGNCLWYAVSSGYKAAPTKATPMNWDTLGQLAVLDTDGHALVEGSGGAAAVIFAVGLPLSARNQLRNVSGTGACAVADLSLLANAAEYAAYIDGSDSFPNAASVVNVYQSKGSSSVASYNYNDQAIRYNDQLMWITPKEIFDRVTRRADFSNPSTSLPVGQINELTDQIRVALEKNIQDDLADPVAATTSHSMPRNTGTYSSPLGSKNVGDLQNTLTIASANYYGNWTEQYRQVMCTSLTSKCLTLGGTTCRGALLFGGRVATGQPRLTAQKSSSIGNLGYYFESPTVAPIAAGGALDLLTLAASTSFSGINAYAPATPNADVGTCLFPADFSSFSQDIGNFRRVITSALRPEAVIDAVGKTITLGDTAATTIGAGCVWFQTPLALNSLLRAYYKVNFANLGEGFIFAVVDAPNNQTALTNGTLCSTLSVNNDTSQLGYSGSAVANVGLSSPKFGLEIDTRSSTGVACSSGSINRNDTSSNHMAWVYWGTAGATANALSDDNCHNAGTLGSGSQPLNPRTLTASSASVQAASWSGNVATVTTAAAHGLSSNQQVTITGMTPTAYNGNYQVAVVDATHLAYSLATSSSSVTLSTIQSTSWNNNVATVTTVANHLMTSGTLVTITGNGAYNVNNASVTVTGNNTFIYALALGADPGNVSGGTVNPCCGTVSTVVGFKNVQSSDTSLPYNGVLPLATSVHVRVDISKAYDATPIQAASWAANVVTVTTAAPHGLLAGQRVSISSSNPAGYNGTYALVSVSDANHFTFALGADPGSYVSGGLIRPPLGVTVAAATRAASGVSFVATITTNTAHGFVTGQPVTIASVSPAAYNGTYQIVVVDATHFTYALGTNPGAYVSGGSLTAAVALTLKAYVASNFPNCTATDFQNLSTDLSNLCAQSPSIQQNNVYMDVNAATGTALSTVFPGFTNAQRSSGSAAGNQALTISGFLLKSQ